MARDTSLSGESGRGQPYHPRPEAREKQAHCSCARRAEGYMCRIDEVMCCEGMEWQRTSLARNRNADRVGIHLFIKEKICLTAMIGIARRLRRSGRMEERSEASGKAGRCFCSRPPAPRAAGAAPTR